MSARRTAEVIELFSGAAYIADDAAPLARIAVEIVRHHRAMAALHALLAVANEVTQNGRRIAVEYDEDRFSAIELDFLDECMTAAAVALVRAQVADLTSDSATA